MGLLPKVPDGVRGIMERLGIGPFHRYLSQTLYPILAGRLDTDGSFIPASLADADARDNRIYYSTDSSKLAYKDSSSVKHDLY